MATREEVEGGRPPLTHHPSPSHGGRWVISGAFLGAGEQGLIPSVLPHVSPVPKARDADQLDDIDSYLTEKYKEEHEEAERVVRPESLIGGSIPTKEGTAGEDHKPQDGEAKVYSPGGVD